MKAFTLIELLVVIAIMGLLGTISVGGYRQMQRGMEERSAVDVASQFIRMAYQRAQIDRKPTVVYFWNELMREKDSEGYENEVVVGKAVAVRRYSRLSGVDGGDFLIDEFADLSLSFPTNAMDEASGASDGNTMRLYNLDSDTSKKYSVVSASATYKEYGEPLLFNYIKDVNDPGNAVFGRWGFEKVDNGNGATWKTGSAYGFEFGTITLPKGYIFTQKYPTQMSAPLEELDNETMVFLPASSAGSSGAGASETIRIYALRPGEGGGLSAQYVGDTKDPGSRMD